MPRQDRELSDIDDERADAQAQIDALQSAAADAEARAATAAAEATTARAEFVEARAELSDARDQAGSAQAELTSIQAELGEAQAARNSAQAELAQARLEISEAGAQLRNAALKYRDARLAAAPHIPSDLVPPADDLAEIDRQFEAAQRVVGQLREKLEHETRSARVPLGAPLRRPPDLSGLSSTEKIKLGLQQLSEREGR